MRPSELFNTFFNSIMLLGPIGLCRVSLSVLRHPVYSRENCFCRRKFLWSQNFHSCESSRLRSDVEHYFRITVDAFIDILGKVLFFNCPVQNLEVFRVESSTLEGRWSAWKMANAGPIRSRRCVLTRLGKSSRLILYLLCVRASYIQTSWKFVGVSWGLRWKKHGRPLAPD